MSPPFPCSECKRECLSEMAGTYLLVLIGPASIVVASLASFLSSLEALSLVALVFGGTVASVILLIGGRSGAHINPAITVASALAGTLKRRWLVPYVVFQVVGGLLAGLTLAVVFGGLGAPTSLGSTKLAVGLTSTEGLALEAGGTFVLAISALSASSIISSPVKQAALVGTTLSILILLVGPLTGASFNPARSIGPSVFSGYFNNQVVYWAGPLLGAGVAGLTFGSVRRVSGKKKLAVVCVRP